MGRWRLPAILLPLALLLALAGLQLKLWWGDGGLRDARLVRDQAEQQRAENETLQLRNDALSAEVDDLKSGEAAVEERARSELGMIKPGETFYRVVDVPRTTTREPAVTPAPSSEDSAAPAAEPAVATDEPSP